ncbi:DUF1854 domain-containing protein [Nitrosomonas sp. JL21]|uniref:cyanophycin metabolism-associated DUF1854 family protein n=1 Tax=Nitrosomonas sp. JL21 TaxID=153949 RepID=UPI00136F0350|nr:DUF1854 domain-containing protein [Nitrosomonas sp. JL21]MBL8497283.1 DUF1854 domain-containing protein [Nitrosomonas sp.]MCC7091444.1 DUF1854 domain-containing protein [Nitrosomonas sp.]MXS77152.1 DUF1854 domain-containing protein [Nitrosomonas sp. JL21]
MSHVPTFELLRNAFGRLVFNDQSGVTLEGVIPVRSFPITDPDQGIALVDAHGHELVWIERLIDLPEGYRQLIEAELVSREFMPEIKRLHKVSSFITPSTWHVETDRGDTSFSLKGEEDIRRLTNSSLMITDSHGVHFLIRNRLALDRHSRKLLDHFL